MSEEPRYEVHRLSDVVSDTEQFMLIRAGYSMLVITDLALVRLAKQKRDIKLQNISREEPKPERNIIHQSYREKMRRTRK